MNALGWVYVVSCVVGFTACCDGVRVLRENGGVFTRGHVLAGFVWTFLPIVNAIHGIGYWSLRAVEPWNKFMEKPVFREKDE